MFLFTSIASALPDLSSAETDISNAGNSSISLRTLNLAESIVVPSLLDSFSLVSVAMKERIFRSSVCSSFTVIELSSFAVLKLLD